VCLNGFSHLRILSLNDFQFTGLDEVIEVCIFKNVIQTNKIMSNLGDSFLWNCKSAYLKGLYPFDFDNIEKQEYKSIIETGKSLIRERGLQGFLGFLMEGQYYIELWAAIIALEYGNIPKEEKLKYNINKTVLECCLSEVKKYIIHSKNTDFKENGRLWLQKILTRYNCNYVED
jgi:hypothetical protein